MRTGKRTKSTGPARPVTVEIERVTAPATFSNLQTATDALWTSLRALPLGSTQYEAYKLFFGPDVVERVAKFLDRDGQLHLSFALHGRPHSVWIRPAEPHHPQCLSSAKNPGGYCGLGNTGASCPIGVARSDAAFYQRSRT